MKKNILLLNLSVACFLFTINAYSQYKSVSDKVQANWEHACPADPYQGNTLDTLIHSPALEDNFVGDSPDRPVRIYLPPGYDDYPDNRYPVIYLLHGYTQTHEMWGDFPLAASLLAAGSIKPIIIVAPNAYNKWHGSFYTNSTVNGNWEDFIVDDLNNFIDSNFNTLPFKESRAIAGFSMGAYGAISLVMKNPGTYNAVYSQDNPLLNFSEKLLTLRRDEMIAAACANDFNIPNLQVRAHIAMATSFATDSFATPFPGRFPLTCGGEMVDSVWEEWLEHDPYTTLPEYKQNLLDLGLLALGCGDQDPNYDIHNRFSQTLTDSGVSHVYEVYEGAGHNARTQPIFELLSKHLANPVPFIRSNSPRFLQQTDTLFVTVDTNAIIYVVPQSAGTTLDSIINKMVFSDTIPADSTLAIPLAELDYGHYRCYAVSEVGYISNIPVHFSLVPDASPPLLSLVSDIVNLGDSIRASISRDGKICIIAIDFFSLETFGTCSEIMNSSRLIVSADALADSEVSFSTEGLSTKTYLIFGFDQYGIVTGPESVQVVKSPSGITTYSLAEITIFPNPVKEMVTIQASSPNKYDIEIISVNGQLLYTDSMEGSIHQIDLSAFQKGVYIITIRSKNSLIARKMIKL